MTSVTYPTNCWFLVMYPGADYSESVVPENTDIIIMKNCWSNLMRDKCDKTVCWYSLHVTELDYVASAVPENTDIIMAKIGVASVTLPTTCLTSVTLPTTCWYSLHVSRT